MYIHKAVKRYIVTIFSRVCRLLPDFSLLSFTSRKPRIKISFHYFQKKGPDLPRMQKTAGRHMPRMDMPVSRILIFLSGPNWGLRYLFILFAGPQWDSYLRPAWKGEVRK